MEQGTRIAHWSARSWTGLSRASSKKNTAPILPPQDVLSKEFDVSRTVMREALSMLLARDMLDVRPKIGTRIRPMSDWRMIDEDVVNWRFRAKPDPLFLRDVIEFRDSDRAARVGAGGGTRQCGGHRGDSRGVRRVPRDPAGRTRLSGRRRTVAYAHRGGERQSVLPADGGDHSRRATGYATDAGGKTWRMGNLRTNA